MNRALLGAIRKGITAREAGLPRSACPYKDIRKTCGRLTWSRAFVTAWLDGYDNCLRETERKALGLPVK